VLCELHQGECSVGALVEAIGLSQSALSQHLAKLREDGLVVTRRDAQTIYYSLANDNASRVIAVLYDLFCADKPARRSKGKAAAR
jgi:DNA-binding transcriptional ArsR family regulator